MEKPGKKTIDMYGRVYQDQLAGIDPQRNIQFSPVTSLVDQIVKVSAEIGSEADRQVSGLINSLVDLTTNYDKHLAEAGKWSEGILARAEAPKTLRERMAMASLMGVPIASDVAGLVADSMMYAQEPGQRTPVNYALSGLGLLPLVPGMTAYHGSPHKFDKFDSSKIGTGEGAQAYGHGLYLAENRGIGQGYSTAGLLHDKGVKVGDRVIQSRGTTGTSPSVEDYAVDALVRFDGDKKKAIDWLDDFGSGKQARDWIKKNIEGDKATLEKSGNLYTVDIPDEQINKMLDWDAPLSEQPEQLAKMVNAGILRKAPAPFEDRYVMQNGTMIDPKDNSGALIINQSKDAEMSNALKAAGIPGIRYLDAGSRGYVVNLTYKGKPYHTAGGEGHKFQTREQADNYAKEKIAEGFGAKVGTQGTRNFVVFDDSILKILKRE